MELKKATPLYVAACYAQFDTVQWLIDRGADSTVPGYRGMKIVVREHYAQTASIHSKLSFILPQEMVGEYRKKDKESVNKCKELLKGPKRGTLSPPSLTNFVITLAPLLSSLVFSSHRPAYTCTKYKDTIADRSISGGTNRIRPSMAGRVTSFFLV
jgi:hypothetical protein